MSSPLATSPTSHTHVDLRKRGISSLRQLAKVLISARVEEAGVRELNLAENALTTLGHGGPGGGAGGAAAGPIALMDRLQVLDVSRNKIASVDQLPDRVRTLIAAYNYIQRFPSPSLQACTAVRVLECLDLSHNQLTSTSGLGECVNLRTLRLDGNRIAMIEGLENLSKLHTLSVTANFIGCMQDVRALAVNGELRALDLSDNPICELENYRVACLQLFSHVKMLDGEARSSRKRRSTSATRPPAVSPDSSSHPPGDPLLTTPSSTRGKKRTSRGGRNSTTPKDKTPNSQAATLYQQSSSNVGNAAHSPRVGPRARLFHEQPSKNKRVKTPTDHRSVSAARTTPPLRPPSNTTTTTSRNISSSSSEERRGRSNARDDKRLSATSDGVLAQTGKKSPQPPRQLTIAEPATPSDAHPDLPLELLDATTTLSDLAGLTTPSLPDHVVPSSTSPGSLPAHNHRVVEKLQSRLDIVQDANVLLKGQLKESMLAQQLWAALSAWAVDCEDERSFIEQAYAAAAQLFASQHVKIFTIDHEQNMLCRRGPDGETDDSFALFPPAGPRGIAGQVAVTATRIVTERAVDHPLHSQAVDGLSHSHSHHSPSPSPSPSHSRRSPASSPASASASASPLLAPAMMCMPIIWAPSTRIADSDPAPTDADEVSDVIADANGGANDHHAHPVREEEQDPPRVMGVLQIVGQKYVCCDATSLEIASTLARHLASGLENCRNRHLAARAFDMALQSLRNIETRLRQGNGLPPRELLRRVASMEAEVEQAHQRMAAEKMQIISMYSARALKQRAFSSWLKVVRHRSMLESLVDARRERTLRKLWYKWRLHGATISAAREAQARARLEEELNQACDERDDIASQYVDFKQRTGHRVNGLLKQFGTLRDRANQQSIALRAVDERNDVVEAELVQQQRASVQHRLRAGFTLLSSIVRSFDRRQLMRRYIIWRETTVAARIAEENEVVAASAEAAAPEAAAAAAAAGGGTPATMVFTSRDASVNRAGDTAVDTLSAELARAEKAKREFLDRSRQAAEMLLGTGAYSDVAARKQDQGGGDMASWPKHRSSSSQMSLENLDRGGLGFSSSTYDSLVVVSVTEAGDDENDERTAAAATSAAATGAPAEQQEGGDSFLWTDELDDDQTSTIPVAATPHTGSDLELNLSGSMLPMSPAPSSIMSTPRTGDESYYNEDTDTPGSGVLLGVPSRSRSRPVSVNKPVFVGRLAAESNGVRDPGREDGGDESSLREYLLQQDASASPTASMSTASSQSRQSRSWDDVLGFDDLDGDDDDSDAGSGAGTPSKREENVGRKDFVQEEPTGRSLASVTTVFDSFAKPVAFGRDRRELAIHRDELLVAVRLVAVYDGIHSLTTLDNDDLEALSSHELQEYTDRRSFSMLCSDILSSA